MNRIHMVLVIALLGMLSACGQPQAGRADAPVMPKVEGCTLERYTVYPGGGGSSEILYVARCVPSKTTSVSAQYNCGKGCTKKVTTITTVEGSPTEEIQK